MPSNGQNGCPELKKLVKNKSPAPKPGHPGEEQQGGGCAFHRLGAIKVAPQRPLPSLLGPERPRQAVWEKGTL